MAVFLGIDTGGTYTDAVVVDAAQTRILGKAKALTTRPDLAPGIAAAIDAALAAAGVAATDVGLVSLSTTLATNALVEGQGGRVALIAIGFDDADRARAGLSDAMAGDPVLRLPGGHTAQGGEAAPFDAGALRAALATLPQGITALAIAAQFAVRNPAHEVAARAIAAETGLPVTCAHDLSARLGGPKRALTAVLNARLTGLITRLIAACTGHLAARGITAPLMVVRGDGALISAAQARARPIETILSGPAASIVGARWLTGATDALVSDIGGTTTDIALLRAGHPAIDPEGAQVGGYRTMVEAVAMRTTGLGGDSAVHVVTEGLAGGLRLGPTRLLPVSLLARTYPALVHATLDRALAGETAGEMDARFALRVDTAPLGLPDREAALLARIDGAAPLSTLLRNRLDHAALEGLRARGHILLAGVTPSDAAHVLGLADVWDREAAQKALAQMARRRGGSGLRIADGAADLARRIVDQMTAQTTRALLEAALAEEGDWDGLSPDALARHPLMTAALGAPGRTLHLSAALAVPVIGLGASAATYYPAVGMRLRTDVIVPTDADVANAIGAVVGQIAMHARGTVTSPAEGRYTAHLPTGPRDFTDRDTALATLTEALTASARAAAIGAGAAEIAVTATTDIRATTAEGRTIFLEADVRVTATGRPRITAPPAFRA